MALDVLVEVGFLSEAQLASEGAGEGSFARVNAQVVVEVMELSEELAAAFEVALEDLETALSQGILVPVYPEVLDQLLGTELRVRA